MDLDNKKAVGPCFHHPWRRFGLFSNDKSDFVGTGRVWAKTKGHELVDYPSSVAIPNQGTVLVPAQMSWHSIVVGTIPFPIVLSAVDGGDICGIVYDADGSFAIHPTNVLVLFPLFLLPLGVTPVRGLEYSKRPSRTSCSARTPTLVVLPIYECKGFHPLITETHKANTYSHDGPSTRHREDMTIGVTIAICMFPHLR